MKVELENVKPMDIEKRSFEIITEELGDKKLVIYEMTGHTAGSVCILDEEDRILFSKRRL